MPQESRDEKLSFVISKNLRRQYVRPGTAESIRSSRVLQLSEKNLALLPHLLEA